MFLSLRSCFVFLLSAVILSVVSAPAVISAGAQTPAEGSPSVSFRDILNIGDDFSLSSEWSPNGDFLIVRSHRSSSQSDTLDRFYLVNIKNRTHAQIDFDVSEEEERRLQWAAWSPDGRCLIVRSGIPGLGGGAADILCRPDGSVIRAVGSSENESLSDIIQSLKSRDCVLISFSPDNGKILYERDAVLGARPAALMVENTDGTNRTELGPSGTCFWIDGDTVLCRLSSSDGEGILQAVNVNGTVEKVILSGDTDPNPVSASFLKEASSAAGPEAMTDKYRVLSVSPDGGKICLFSVCGSSAVYEVIRSDGTGLTPVSFISGDDKMPSFQWSPSGSALLVNEGGSLFLIEEDAHEKRLLYSGNASEEQWFPAGDKILFIENGSEIRSIDTDKATTTTVTKRGIPNEYIFRGKRRLFLQPDGDRIVFAAALDADGHISTIETDIEGSYNFSGPLYMINADGSDLTAVTKAVTGKYETVSNQAPSGDLIMTESLRLAENIRDRKDGCLYSLSGADLSSGWRKAPISEVIGPDILSGPASSEETVPPSDGRASSENRRSDDFSIPSFTGPLAAAGILFACFLNRRRS